MMLPPKQKVLELLKVISMNLRERTKQSLLNIVVSPKEQFFIQQLQLGNDGLEQDTKDYIISNLTKVFKRYPVEGQMFTKKLIKELKKYLIVGLKVEVFHLLLLIILLILLQKDWTKQEDGFIH